MYSFRRRNPYVTRRKWAERWNRLMFQGNRVTAWPMQRKFLSLSFLEVVEKVVEMFVYKGADILILGCRACGLNCYVSRRQRHRRLHFPNGYEDF